MSRFPTLEIRELREEFCEFILRDTDVSIVNALRRVMIAWVPTIAIDHVEFQINTSVLTDDFIAHRLGMIPFKSGKLTSSTKSRYEHFDIDNILELNFSLNVRCLDSEETIYVTSNDLHIDSKFPSIFPVDYNPKLGRKNLLTIKNQIPIVICKLRSGQQLKLKAYATRGFGKDHVKWSPVSTAVFQFSPEIEINEIVAGNLNKDQKVRFINHCSGKSEKKWAIEGGKRKLFRLNPLNYFLELTDPEVYSYDGDCLKEAERMGFRELIKIKPLQNRFVFRLQTTRALSASEVIQDSFDYLVGRLREMLNEVSRKTKD